MCYPHSVYSRHDGENMKRRYENLGMKLWRELERWPDYRDNRSLIQTVFILAKDALSLKRLYRNTRRSVAKFVYVNVLLTGIVISLGFS